jgi:hypothetical protein
MRFARFTLWTILMACLFAGCATGPKTDWNDSIGNYTYEQSVQELGVPLKSAKLGDGSLVAEWLVGTSAKVAVRFDLISDTLLPYREDPGIVIEFPGGQESGQYVRLVFGPDGELRSWKSYKR